MSEININNLQDKERSLLVEEQQENERFIEEHYPLLKTISASIAGSKKLPPGVVFDDLVSWGVEGLLKARKGFSDEKGASFSTYASYRIRGEILDKIRQDWNYRSPNEYKRYREELKKKIMEVADGFSEEADEDGNVQTVNEKVNQLISSSAMTYVISSDPPKPVESDEIADPSEDLLTKVAENDDQSILWDELKTLDPVERKIMIMFYFKDMSQKDIAEVLDFSRSKICRMHNKILEKLKGRLRRRIER